MPNTSSCSSASARACVAERLGAREVALGPGQHARPPERLDAVGRRGVARRSPAPAPATRTLRAGGRGGTRRPRARRPGAAPAPASPRSISQAMRRAQVGVLRFQPLAPPPLLRPEQLRLGPFRQGQAPRRVPAPRRSPRRRWPPAAPARTRGSSPASGSAARRRRPSSCRSRLLSTSEAMPSRTDEGDGMRSGVERPPTPRLPTPATASAASSVKPPAKTARRRKRACSSAVEQVVAPGDGVAHRLQAVGQVARRRRSGAAGAVPAAPAAPAAAGRRSRAAASSIASGRPSRRRQMPRHGGAFVVGQRRRSGRTPRARVARRGRPPGTAGDVCRPGATPGVRHGQRAGPGLVLAATGAAAPGW